MFFARQYDLEHIPLVTYPNDHIRRRLYSPKLYRHSKIRGSSVLVILEKQYSKIRGSSVLVTLGPLLYGARSAAEK